jgi:hypothetical protein
MTNPHRNDYCVVCGDSPSSDGPKMHPVVGIDDGVVCEKHITERKDSASFGGYQ